MYHRDFLINAGPRPFGNLHISFVAHDRGWNNRTTVYTHEVWLLLIGLNLDLWSYSLVEKAISKFGKLIVWEKDHNHMGRTLAKARVTSLDDVPWFLNFLEEEPESDSWTVQTEIIMFRMLGALPQDEDFPPEDPDDIDPNHFHFFGFGQARQGPPPPPAPNANAPGIAPNQFAADQADPAWVAWPNQNVAQPLPVQVQAQPIMQINQPKAQVVEQADPLPEEEEVVQAQDLQEEIVEEVIVNQGDVLAMDEATDSNDDFQQTPPPLQPEVQVNIPVLQNPQA